MELRQRSSRAVHAPVGPRHWRAHTPKKIAISITAELIAIRRGRHKSLPQGRESGKCHTRIGGVRGGPVACRRHTLRRRLQPDGDDRKRCFPTAKGTFLEHLIQSHATLAHWRDPRRARRERGGDSHDREAGHSLVFVNPRWEQANCRPSARGSAALRGSKPKGSFSARSIIQLVMQGWSAIWWRNFI